MGLFNNLFGKESSEANERQKELPWIPLTSLDQLDEIEKKSAARPQFIFKHSTTCGISRMVLKLFKGSYTLQDGQADLYYLDLHSYRDVSNEIASRFQVLHQSPQLLVIKNGTTVANTSHGAISATELIDYV